ncbi:MAG: UbiA prenyltransferase family protein [Chitinophagaceae bacterium]|nr:UbiA prenyltransferase family protein [Chitinophagaceae bacterium]
MPVFWFAVSQLVYLNVSDALWVFFILHLLVYPASNGYNSFMDRDTGSIGGVKKPMEPTRQLLYVTVALDVVAVIAGLWISYYFAAGILAYILVSKAYSYRGIRLKKYPVWGYLSVIIFQGAVTFWLVYHGCSANKTLDVPYIPMIVASLLIGGFYPLTQIYQYDDDRKDGVTTMSYLLGYKGTFLYCGLVYGIAFVLLSYYFFYTLQQTAFYIFSAGMLPVLIYFFVWAKKVWRNSLNADYTHTMRMNSIASICINTTFIVIFLINHFE